MKVLLIKMLSKIALATHKENISLAQLLGVSGKYHRSLKTQDTCLGMRTY